MSPLKILLPSHETLSIVFAPHAPEMKKRRKKNVRTCAAQRRRNRRLQSVGPLLPAGAPPPAAAAGHHRCPCPPPASKTAAAATVDLPLGVLQQRRCIQVPHMPHLILYIVIPFPSSPFPSLLGFGRTLCLRRRPRPPLATLGLPGAKLTPTTAGRPQVVAAPTLVCWRPASEPHEPRAASHGAVPSRSRC